MRMCMRMAVHVRVRMLYASARAINRAAIGVTLQLRPVLRLGLEPLLTLRWQICQMRSDGVRLCPMVFDGVSQCQVTPIRHTHAP